VLEPFFFLLGMPDGIPELVAPKTISEEKKKGIRACLQSFVPIFHHPFWHDIIYEQNTFIATWAESAPPTFKLTAISPLVPTSNPNQPHPSSTYCTLTHLTTNTTNTKPRISNLDITATNSKFPISLSLLFLLLYFSFFSFLLTHFFMFYFTLFYI
jgi:hypothetical protein